MSQKKSSFKCVPYVTNVTSITNVTILRLVTNVRIVTCQNHHIGHNCHIGHNYYISHNVHICQNCQILTTSPKCHNGHIDSEFYTFHYCDHKMFIVIFHYSTSKWTLLNDRQNCLISRDYVTDNDFCKNQEWRSL